MELSIAVAVASILVLSGAAALVRRITPLRVCPVCAGVSGTWVWMLLARAAGYPQDERTILLLMGGSVVGIAYQLERHVREDRQAWFKLSFIAFGVVGAWSLVAGSWSVFAAVAVDFLFLGGCFFPTGRFLMAPSIRPVGGRSKPYGPSMDTG